MLLLLLLVLLLPLVLPLLLLLVLLQLLLRLPLLLLLLLTCNPAPQLKAAATVDSTPAASWDASRVYTQTHTAKQRVTPQPLQHYALLLGCLVL